MRLFVSCIACLLLLPQVSFGGLVTTTGVSVNSGAYGAIGFSGVTVNAGDYVVVAHTNNKRDNGNNTISVTSTGTDAFSSLNGGDAGSGGGAGAWMFYTQASSSGTFDLTLDTNNATKTVSQASTYWIVSGTGGDTVALAGTGQNAASGVTTLSLDIPFGGSTLVNGVAFSTGALNGAGSTGIVEDGSIWTQVGIASSIRKTYIDSIVNGTDLNSTFTSSASANIALAGVAFTAVAVPEPSSLAMLGLGGLAMLRRRRKM